MRSIFADERIWRWLSHIWMVLTFGAGLLEIFSQKHSFIITPVAIIYVAVLSLYAGTKEFSRWHELYQSKRHPGEYMVVLWTIFIISVFLYISFSDRPFSLPEEIVSAYIAVLGIFAITSRSKLEYEKQQQTKG